VFATPRGETPDPGATVIVVFVKDGDILVWDEATGRTSTLFAAGDAIRVSMSDDGQVAAFLRRSLVQRSELDWYEQSALWAVDRTGEGPRQLVSAEELRRLLNASETESTSMPQLDWIPGTHRLLFSGWTYIVQAEGESHAVPEGLYVADADTSELSVLAPAGDNLRFVPSPDGAWIALISSTGLSFLAGDGSSLRQDVLTYPPVGLLGPLFPVGVWSQDSSAFVVTGSLEDSPSTNQNFTIWRVPVDGSSAEPLAAVTDSIVDSVAFSPDGLRAAFFRHAGPAGQATDFGWYVTPLHPETGALAVPRWASLFWRNLHWSPSGVGYAFADGSLHRLCPEAAQDLEVCGEGLSLGDEIASFYWIDDDRFLFVTREPYDLYFGRLDGTRVRIAEGAESFAAVAMTCSNDAELVPEATGSAPQQAAPDTVVLTNWRVRNTGTCVWDPSYRLSFLGGERLGGPRSLFLRETVPPGEEVEFLVRVITPAAAGAHRGQWQMFGPDGTPFGAVASIDLVVPFAEAVSLAPGQIVARVSVGRNPAGVAIGDGSAWVTNESAGTVSRIDIETNQAVATVPVGNLPRPVTVGHGAVWVGNLGDGTVSRIDPLTNSVAATIPLDPSPQDFGTQPSGISAGADAIWVAGGVTGADHGNVARIDPETNRIVALIEVERWPAQVAATEDAVWVTHSVTPFLTRIDPATNEVSAILGVDCPTNGLAADAAGVWAACGSEPVLLRLDQLTNQIVARIAVGHLIEGVALGQDAIWVTSGAENTAISVDPDTSLAISVYSVGQGPRGAAVFQGELWVVMSGEVTVWRIRP
jgi:YVTN family beta-propeller protein